jgi:hypothetical protein
MPDPQHCPTVPTQAKKAFCTSTTDEEFSTELYSHSFLAVTSVADPDPGSSAFFTLDPGSGIVFFPDTGSRIPDPKPIFLIA